MSITWPDLRTLELLLATARLGSLTAAASEVGLAQPNASRQLRRLEHELGMKLLERGPRGSVLTPDGRLVAEWAAPVLERARAWRTGTAALRSPRREALEVAASQTIAEALAPRWLAIYHAQHPGRDVTLLVTNSTGVAAAVRSGTAHVGFVESPTAPRDLARAKVGTDRLCLVVSPGHAWARRKLPVPLADVAATPLVVRESGSGTRDTYERAVKGLAVADPALVLSSNAAVLGSVAVGAAPAVLSELAIESAVAAGSVARVRVDPPDAFERTLRAVWRPQPAPAAAVQEFLQIAMGS